MSFELGINLCTKGVCMWSCALSYIPFRLMLDTFVLFRTWMYTIETDLLSSWLKYTVTVPSSLSLYQLKDISFSQDTPNRPIASLIITGCQYRILMQSWYKLPVSCYWNVSYAVSRMYVFPIDAFLIHCVEDLVELCIKPLKLHWRSFKRNPALGKSKVRMCAGRVHLFLIQLGYRQAKLVYRYKGIFLIKTLHYLGFCVRKVIKETRLLSLRSSLAYHSILLRQ